MLTTNKFTYGTPFAVGGKDTHVPRQGMNDFNDFLALFRLTLSPLEIIVRGSAMYWFLFALFRFVLRRDAGSIAIADLLLLVLIADASQNAMAGDSRSIADGCLLVVVIAGWNYLLDWGAYNFTAVRRLVEAKPLPLIRDGRLLRSNMRRELITVEELQARMREEGVSEIAEVRTAYMESNGEISLLLAEDAGRKKGGGQKPATAAEDGEKVSVKKQPRQRRGAKSPLP